MRLRLLVPTLAWRKFISAGNFAAIAPTIQRYLDSDVYAATREAPPAE
jgi:hypothetical protein